MNWLILSGVIVIIGVFTVVLVECRWYQNGLIFYDIETKQIILPPTVSIHRARSLNMPNMPIFSTLGKPCTCQGLKCGCCAGLEVREYNFNQKMCANVTYVPEKREALLDVFLNEMNGARYGISARNPSPICVPIMMPIPMAACIQMTQVGLKGDNLHMCMDFVMRLHTTDAMELHFNCLSMGLDGFQYLDPNGNQVLPRLEEDEGNSIDDGDNSEDDDYEYNDTAEESQDNLTNEEEQNYDEESDDDSDQNKVVDETDEYYEDTEDLENNEVENEVMEQDFQEQKTKSKQEAPSTVKNYNRGNLIIVYETDV
ncbi:acidic leucine-rich nuclear phosphoprotein 32 family member E [Eupeodes corollae]|uniref:acidic leucine-rich nuclear phosphoprotein 32 family member E n=1 Tax=Eupeodes corollae TaxID=290404 RepID=UPI002492B8E8|nr:acidic leucine-rich nuclear phosphoprotein 32 family member E [Eupeodes corollae]